MPAATDIGITRMIGRLSITTAPHLCYIHARTRRLQSGFHHTYAAVRAKQALVQRHGYICVPAICLGIRLHFIPGPLRGMPLFRPAHNDRPKSISLASLGWSLSKARFPAWRLVTRGDASSICLLLAGISIIGVIN